MKLDCGSSVVRDWRDDDRDSLLRFANNRGIWRNLKDRFPHPYGEAEADAWLALVRVRPERTGWAIEVDGLAVGGIGLKPGEDVYMTDAVRAVSDHALSRLGFARVEATVYEWNPASMRVLEKCGFKREGVMRKSIFKDGQLIDGVMYSRVAG